MRYTTAVNVKLKLSNNQEIEVYTLIDIDTGDITYMDITFDGYAVSSHSLDKIKEEIDTFLKKENLKVVSSSYSSQKGYIKSIDSFMGELKAL